MRFRVISLAALLCISVQPAVAQPIIQAVPERPRITVGGYGETKTPPDIATLTYTVRGEGATSDDAVRSMNRQGTGIEAALRKIDAAAEPLTGDVQIAPVRSDDCKEEYDRPLLSTGPCAVLGYVATQSVTVRTTAVKGAGTMVGLISRGGAFEAQISSFNLRDPQLAQQRATDAALSDAARKAAAIATASHVKLGEILSINTTPQEIGEVVMFANNAPPPAEVVAAPPVQVNLNPEPIKTNANVTVSYAIGR